MEKFDPNMGLGTLLTHATEGGDPRLRARHPDLPDLRF